MSPPLQGKKSYIIRKQTADSTAAAEIGAGEAGRGQPLPRGREAPGREARSPASRAAAGETVPTTGTWPAPTLIAPGRPQPFWTTLSVPRHHHHRPAPRAPEPDFFLLPPDQSIWGGSSPRVPGWWWGAPRRPHSASHVVTARLLPPAPRHPARTLCLPPRPAPPLESRRAWGLLVATECAAPAPLVFRQENE